MVLRKTDSAKSRIDLFLVQSHPIALYELAPDCVGPVGDTAGPQGPERYPSRVSAERYFRFNHKVAQVLGLNVPEGLVWQGNEIVR